MSDIDGTDGDESLREAVERSRSGAPAVGSVVRDRFSSDEVFQRIVAAADEEITSGARELFFSALAAGFAITITFMLYVSMKTSTDSDPVLSALLYPLGFIYIIIGGYQLYTENTLPPVALTLERLASVPALLRNWLVVLTGNFTGGALGAAALVFGGVLSPEAGTVAAEIAREGVATAWWSLFSKAAFAGLIVAGVVWVEYAARDTISRLVVVYLAFLAIPLGGLYHSVVAFTEMTYLALHGDLALGVGLMEFVLPVLLGNTVGGVVLVTVVNYFQTTEERLESARFEGAARQLSLPEWALGSLAGRSYVPLLDTEDAPVVADDDAYRILVPILNPRTEGDLVRLAALLASEREDAVVSPVHIVQTPTDRSRYGSTERQQVVEESNKLMADLAEVAAEYDIEYESSTVVSQRSFEALFEVARRNHADLVVMQWDDDRVWGAARANRSLSDLTRELPCDFLVLKNRGFDPSDILLPTEEGQNCELSAEVGRRLRDAVGADLSLLHVVDSAEDRPAGEQFLERWAREQQLEGATRTVDDSGDVEAAIAREARSRSLVIIGATERGLLSRLVHDSLNLAVIDDIECSVLLTERATSRSLSERLFGRR
ncbi:formate/nitrite transporter family protein [Halomicroarcula sp. GCM10025324]|uniref:formate/nitrite transporter family protein n=1 Tax=Haloarcula TaxID=2237 RepID=UPI0023E821D5|nr:formate/nitrite transporter family protein [Halomicroarcula sp. ZS-22-S1]